MKNKKKLFIYIEAAILAFVMFWSFTDGFTKSLHESLGLSDKSKSIFDIIVGDFDEKKLFVGIIILALSMLVIIIFTRKKKDEAK